MNVNKQSGGVWKKKFPKRSTGKVIGKGTYGVIVSTGNYTIIKKQNNLTSIIMDSAISKLATNENLRDVIHCHDVNEKKIELDEYYTDLYNIDMILNKLHEDKDEFSNFVMNLLYKLVDCINTLHNYNIYHFDIKPENILIGKRIDDNYVDIDEIAIVDFGISKFGTGIRYVDAYMAYTPQYKSPEISYSVLDPLRFNPIYLDSAEIWAIAMTLLKTFKHNTLHDIRLFAYLYKVDVDFLKNQYEKYENIEDLKKLKPNTNRLSKISPICDVKSTDFCDRQVTDIIMKMLEHNPSNRMTFDEFFNSTVFSLHSQYQEFKSFEKRLFDRLYFQSSLSTTLNVFNKIIKFCRYTDLDKLGISNINLKYNYELYFVAANIFDIYINLEPDTKNIKYILLASVLISYSITFVSEHMSMERHIQKISHKLNIDKQVILNYIYIVLKKIDYDILKTTIYHMIYLKMLQSNFSPKRQALITYLHIIDITKQKINKTWSLENVQSYIDKLIKRSYSIKEKSCIKYFQISHPT